MKKILFVNPVNPDLTTAIFDGNTWIFVSLSKEGYTDFIHAFQAHIQFLFSTYTPQEIWCIPGPGPFTRVRIVTLVLNTICYVHPSIILRSRDFFDCIPPEYTPLLEINFHEYLSKYDNKVSYIRKQDLPSGKYIGYFGENHLSDDKNCVQYKEDMYYLSKLFFDSPPLSLIQPIYIKPPHITCSKK